MDALATSHGEARHVGDYLRCHPCVLAGGDMPTPLFNVLRQWIEAWMMTPQAWSRARDATSPPGCPSRWCYEMVHRFRPQSSAEPAQPTLHMDRGVKQADSLSTVLFTLYLDKALQLANSRFDAIADLNNWDVRPQLHSPAGRCYFDASQSPACDAGPVRLSHLAYADDITIPLSHPSPRVLVNATAKMIETIHVAMTEFGLAINFDPHKTGLCLRLVGGEGRGVWQFIKNSSSALSTSCSSRATKSATLPFVISPSLTVHITDSYKYLGKITSPTLAHDAEIKARKTATVAAFQENRRVLTSSHTQLRHKIQLYKTLCMPHLLQQLHTSPKLPDKAFQQLEHIYISHLKYIARLNLTSPMRWRDVRDCEVLRLLGEPPLRHHLMCRRLMHMRKLVVHNDLHIQAALNVTSKSSIWHRWLEDLTLLQVLTPGLRLLPPPSLTTISDWLAFIVPADVVWPRILKQHTTPIDTAARSLSSLTIDPATDPYLVELPGLPDDHEIPHVVAPPQPRATTDPTFNADHHCHICFRYFTTTQGLLTHKYKHHNLPSPISLRVTSSVCPICDAELTTRAQLLQHLANGPACGLPLLLFVEPMSIADHNQRVTEMNRENASLTRNAIPRRGPRRLVDGLPSSSSVLPIDPFATDGHFGDIS
eukprot:3706461-Amphidinium_carterae.1